MGQFKSSQLVITLLLLDRQTDRQTRKILNKKKEIPQAIQNLQKPKKKKKEEEEEAQPSNKESEEINQLKKI